MFSDPIKNIAELGVEHGMKIVDIGSGSGFYAIELAKKVGPSGRVYAVDIQQDLLTRIKNSAMGAGLHNIEVINGDVEKLGGTKVREAIAERVVFSNTLFQIDPKSRDNVALEIKRLLKSGGKLMVVDWNEDSSFKPTEAVPQSLAQGLFEKNGFKIEKTFDAGDHHYGMIFKKI